MSFKAKGEGKGKRKRKSKSKRKSSSAPKSPKRSRGGSTAKKSGKKGGHRRAKKRYSLATTIGGIVTFNEAVIEPVVATVKNNWPLSALMQELAYKNLGISSQGGSGGVKYWTAPWDYKRVLKTWGPLALGKGIAYAGQEFGMNKGWPDIPVIRRFKV